MGLLPSLAHTLRRDTLPRCAAVASGWWPPSSPSRHVSRRRLAPGALCRCAVVSPWLYLLLAHDTRGRRANETFHGLCPVRPLHRPNHAGVFGHPGVGYLAPEAACCARIKGIERGAD